MPMRLRAALAAAGTGILVGSGIVATRVAVGEASPIALAFMRYLIGCFCLLPLVLAGPRPRFAGRDVLPIALLGIVQFGVLVVLLNVALRSIPAARAALIFATMPLLTMVLAALKGQERVTAAKTAGVLLTILGVALALGDAAWNPSAGSSAWIGTAASFLSALSGALCSILYRPYLARYPTLPVSALAMLASVVFLAVPAGFEGFFAAWPALTPASWLAVLFIGVNSGVGYYLWLWALNHAPATNVTVFLALSPVTAAALGAALLGEAVSLAMLLGLVSVVAGLILAHLSRR